ncbi:unnamed protein product [Taenia asiatica]|uniref:Non-specific serine/threonine protein kinase n=1 Tax=Taenia asiatica TaxID=60517 RepID=A0A0R3W3H7_TAEAS|nr:unnamed protein product [Taenia asiatica]
MLLRTSQAEIAKLKRGPENTTKSCAHSNHRSRGVSMLDPRRSIDHADLIGCLHTPLNYKITTCSKHVPALRSAGLRNAGRSFSSSSGSSSASSSSSSSSLSSSSASACQKRPRSRQHWQPPPLSASTSRRPLALTSSTNSQSGRPRNHHFSAESNQIPCRNHKPPECLASSSISGVKLGATKGTEKHLEPVMADASTGVEDGPAAHLMRLVRASVRSAREHHSASVKLAPSTEGKYLDESEKAIVDAFYHAEEERCISASKRPRSQSPQRSLPFSPTLFARRQMLKHSSLCSLNPSAFCNITATTTSASTSDLLPRNSVTSGTPHSFNADHTEAKSKKMEYVSCPASSAPTTASVGRASTPEGEAKYVDTDVEVVEVEKKKQQKMKVRAEVVVMGGEREPSFDEDENRTRVDSPRIEIEDAISEVASRPDAEGVEAMSEGEVNDEEEEDAMEEEPRDERTNNSNNSHRKAHRSGRIHGQWLHHHTECSTALHHSPPKSMQHKPHHRVITSHERRCKVEPVESPPSKRTRRLSDERESYLRFRNSPPRRAHNHPRVPAPRPPASIACRRFLSTSGGGGKFVNVLVHRTRPSPAFVSHRSSAVVFRSSRRSVTQRSFTQRH